MADNFSRRQVLKTGCAFIAGGASSLLFRIS
jgi:hypothetical protein